MLYLFLSLLFTGSLFADNGRSSGNMTQTLVIIVVFIVFFYFILYRPEQKRRKQLEQQRSSLKQGDKVTAMGILGEVDEIKEETIVLKMIDGNKIEFLKAAVTEIRNPQK